MSGYAALVGAKVRGGKPAVLVGGGLLPLVQQVKTSADSTRTAWTPVLDDVTVHPGELQRVLRDRLPSCAGSTEMRVSWYGSATAGGLAGASTPGSDHAPMVNQKGRSGVMRIPASAAAAPAPSSIHRQHPSGLPVDGQLGSVTSSSRRRIRSRPTRRSWRSGYPGCAGHRPPSAPV